MENTEYASRLRHVTVLGAAGKMGSGILLLTALEMAAMKRDPQNQGIDFILHAMDISEEGLKGVMEYLKKQARKTGEKKIEKIKELYSGIPGLATDENILEQYVTDVLAIVKPVTQIDPAYESSLIFEAVSEDQALKVRLLKDIDSHNPNKPWYLTNTSSVPIHELNELAGLGGRILGFHFYNPPAIQKLVELIVAKDTLPELAGFAKLLVSKLGKIAVPSKDIAGFIGNGHFIRDALYGIEKAEELAGEFSFPGAVYAVNTVSQKFLIRPMGIFQLIDYVGVDVVQQIMSIMDQRLFDQALHSPVIDQLNDMGVKGGQNPDGSQKDGFLRYSEGKITGIFDPEKNTYVPVEELKLLVDEKLGPLPEGMIPWKDMIRDPEKEEKLEMIFKNMKGMTTLGSRLAMELGLYSTDISYQLVWEGVATSKEDLNTVLLTGFFHAYGPINNYFTKP